MGREGRYRRVNQKFHRSSLILFSTVLGLALPAAKGLQAAAAGSSDRARVECNLSYVPGGGHKQQLDLYLPGVRDFPSILFVHGGSLSTGDRGEAPYSTACEPLQRAGLGCASISYRLFPDVHWPEPARDAASSFAWLKRNIASRGGNPGRIFLAGHSSGCLLASLLGTDPKYLHERGFSQADVAGVIAIGCRLNDRIESAGIPPERIRRHFQTDPYDSMFGSLDALNDAVPAAHVRPGLPAFLVLMGDQERYQPPLLADAGFFEAEAMSGGARVDIRVLPERTHMGVIAKLVTRGDETLPAIVNFVASGSPQAPSARRPD